jgi:BirA family biotin operon repressor/biotin-[acetyl-CoA-carboxylase] ligase
MKEFPQDIEKTATSVCMEKGKPADRNRIIAAFCNYFENYYERFLKGCGMKLLMDEYNKYLINTGRTIRVLDPAGEYTGISSGINDNGELIVKKEDGTFVTVMSGEVSVRGVYGYV